MEGSLLWKIDLVIKDNYEIMFLSLISKDSACVL
jgi:hypothetical protein